MGLGEAGALVVVVVLELGGAPDQALALGDGLAGQRVPLCREVAVDAVAGVVDVEVEARAEHGALVVVLRLVEHRLAPSGEAVEEGRRAVDGVGAALAVEGVGRGEQRVLLGCDEAVDQALDAMRIDGAEIGRRRLGLLHPLRRDVELAAHGAPPAKLVRVVMREKVRAPRAASY